MDLTELGYQFAHLLDEKWKGVFPLDLANALGDLRIEISRYQIALQKSIKLQSHYAKLLNMYDGGLRMQFKDEHEWIARLIKIKEIK